MPTNLTKPSSLAGVGVRATRAGSWPNVSVSGFVLQPNSSSPRRSDNAVQKIWRPEPEADVNARSTNSSALLRFLSKRATDRPRLAPRTSACARSRLPVTNTTAGRFSFRTLCEMSRFGYPDCEHPRDPQSTEVNGQEYIRLTCGPHSYSTSNPRK
jgi:hypothetical protein